LVEILNGEKQNMKNDDWFEREHKSMIKGAIIVWIINLVFAVSAIGGVIYFIFWCLKHFGIIE
jgi:hypothetical protein